MENTVRRRRHDTQVSFKAQRARGLTSPAGSSNARAADVRKPESRVWLGMSVALLQRLLSAELTRDTVIHHKLSSRTRGLGVVSGGGTLGESEEVNVISI